ncbi:MAG: response regulator [Planctomycetota bacterium]
MKAQRIPLADDHQVFLEGLERLLERDFEIVGSVQSGPQLVALADGSSPDRIMTDGTMPERCGLEAVKAIRDKGLSPEGIILTMHGDPACAPQTIENGVDGYVLKRAATSELVSAIEEALAGGCWISPALAARIIRHQNSDEGASDAALTERQQRILRSLVDGKIAE